MDYYNQLKKLPPNFSLIIPFRGHHSDLMTELAMKNKKVLLEHPSLIICESIEDKKIIWAQDIWRTCQAMEIESLNQGISLISKFKNRGCYYSEPKSNFGLALSKKVKNLELKRIQFDLKNNFDFKFTAWTMLDHFVVFSESALQRFPFGWHEFNEDKITPPNRAYLKLWEIITVHQIFPQAKENVIELGASPGGWTWVLSQICQKVYSFDRSPLDKKISDIKNIYHSEGDAFGIKPSDYSDCTWLFSDLICTPEKLYETIQFWLKNSDIRNFVCTIKFKGSCDFDILTKFLEIENSKVVHLYHNKNEVTWIKTKE